MSPTPSLSSDEKHKDGKDSNAIVEEVIVHPDSGRLKRNIGVLAMIGLSMSICNGWAAMSSTIVIGLTQGGTVVILYGLFFTSIINVFLALSLGEMAAAYPSAGGQYVWTSILASPKSKRAFSFIVGWTTIFEWITIVASVVIISSDVVFGLVTLFNDQFIVQPWHIFVVYQAINSIALCNNLFILPRLPRIGTFFLVFSTMIFLSILISCVAKSPSYRDNTFVWGTFTNGTEWSSNFIVVALGLINSGYVFAGLDGAIHIAEECLKPARAVPIALLSTVGMGFLTGLTFSVGLLYCVQDLDAATAAELPFLEIIYQATSSTAACVVFMTAFLIVLMISSNSVHQATSRLIWSFARDQGLPFSTNLAKVNAKLHVPIGPLIISWAGVTILGLLYIASTTVYGSIIAVCIILGNLSYAIPAMLLMLKGRRMNPNRWLKLGAFGWIANIITVVWTAFTTIMWLFPSTPHPDGLSMNYSVAVLAGMALIAAVDWVIYARKHYTTPDVSECLDLEFAE